jgi:hypothetical protein
MPRLIITILTISAVLCGLTAAQAGVVVTVDKSAQRLTVTVDGARRYEWPVSTARAGYNTPNGSYRPERLERQWFSRRYDWSPMPYSIFFDGGYAIHGSYEVSRLGTPASHGCIRLHPKNAAILFGLVQEHRNDTRIVVTGDGYAPMVRERYDGYVSQVRYRSAPRDVYESRGPARYVVEGRRSRSNFADSFDEPPRR